MQTTHDYLPEAAFQSLPAQVAVLDRDGIIIFVNAAWKAFAYENGAPALAENSVGINYLEVCDRAIEAKSELAQEAQTGLEAILAGSLSLFTLEYPCHSPQEQRWFLMYATPLLGETGKAVVAHLNITQRKHLERLTAANQEMSDFLSLITHEVRTPLTSINGYVQLAQRHLQGIQNEATSTGQSKSSLEHPIASLSEDLQQIITHTKRLNRLVADLAEAAQMQSSKLTIQPERLDLRRIVWETVQEQQQTRPDRTLRLTLPEQPVPTDADGDRIRQVLTNYLVNAFKYAPAALPIVINLKVQEKQAYVEVCDQGPGLPLEEQAYIWKRWYRVPHAQTEEDSRTSMGMGLFICRRIIALHGGETGVVSAPGQGATFWFTLPLQAPKAGART
jgi:signal transduction histidine kinase